MELELLNDKVEVNQYLSKLFPYGTYDVTFQDEGHRYDMYSNVFNTWISTEPQEGLPHLISVTTVLGKYFTFDREKSAKGLFFSQREKMLTDPTHKYYGCRSPEDVMAKWDANATAGTIMHAFFETLVNLYEYERWIYESKLKIIPPEHPRFPEHQYFFKFLDHFEMLEEKPRHSFRRSEIILAHDLLHITGTVDALLFDNELQQHVIVDWKRCSKPVTLTTNAKRKYYCTGAAAFRKLENNSYHKYSCQLSLYKYMFEAMTGHKVAKLFIAVVDSTRIGEPDALDIIPVDFMEYEDAIRTILTNRAKEVLEHLEISQSEKFQQERQKSIQALRDYIEQIRNKTIYLN